MPDFKLDRIRFTWRGTWQSRTKYNPDDIVSYGGNVYVCLTRHDAAFDFNNDLNFFNNDIPPVLTPRWILLSEGTSWKQEWQPETRYKIGDIVRYGGIIYLCTEGHVSAANTVSDQGVFVNDNFNDDFVEENYWIVQVSADSWAQDWAEARFYRVNDVVRYGGIVYRCVANHVSSATDSGLEVNQDSWEQVNVTDSWRGDWTVSARFKENDVVRYGGIVYRCLVGHTSSDNIDEGLEIDQANWEIVVSGIEYKGNWTDGVRYKLNDVVKYGSYLYITHTPHTSTNDPGFATENFDVFCPGQEYDAEWDENTVYQVGDIVRYGGALFVNQVGGAGVTPDPDAQVNWILLLNDTNVRGDWNIRTSYRIGDVVRRNGNVYVAKKDSIGEDTDIIDDDSTVNSEFWELLLPGEKWAGIWAVGNTYVIGDTVVWVSSAYRCVNKHVSSLVEQPDQDFDRAYWEPYALGNENNVLSGVGDLLTYGVQADGSSIGNTRVPAGTEKDSVISTGTSPDWTSLNSTPKVYYVATNGEDQPDLGTSQNAPWRTLRYALENITGPATVFVRTGVFDEILPLRIPAFVAVVGDELRSTVIRPGAPIFSDDDILKIKDLISYYRVIAPFIVQNDEIGTLDEESAAFGTTVYSTLSQNLVGTPGNSNIATGVSEQFSTLIDNLTGVSSAGANSPSPEADVIATLERIETNRDFIEAEMKGYLTATYPSYSITADTLNKVVDRILDSIIYDIRYPGNFKIRDAATYFVHGNNEVLNKKSNMFLLRDGTGLRNCTLSGLEGELGELNTFLTRRPTAGAYASLDPGWGPSDNSAWVGTKSPYVQNVSTFGTGCIGLKIDGDLHGGGNQTIVSNDFTQILSDGIGVWCNGTGKTEAVSVFTYYNHIGYLCTFGGKIRGTNGNCSYGQYGAVAEGSNISEDPITCQVNNRFFDATVGTAFASGGEIIKLFYSHAGEEYTEATYNVVGAGVNIDLEGDEFRDGAVFENRIIDPGDSSPAGGGGYFFNSNVSQGGDNIEITLAGSDDNEASVYRNLRLVLSSGTGAGQYGYIAEYDADNKIAYIGDERFPQKSVNSTASSGNIIQLDSTAGLKVDDPVIFTSEEHYGNIQPLTVYYVRTVDSSTTITISATQGGSVFNLINGTGEMTLHHLGFNHFNQGYPIETVLDSTTNYTIEPRLTYSSPGFSSAAGVMPSDSRWIGTAYGNDTFVAIADDGGLGTNVAAYSANGTSWTATTLPQVAHWRSLAFGDGKFVAVGEAGVGAVSEDGISWSSVSLPNANYEGVAYGDGAWIAVALGENFAARSTDATTWTQVSMPGGAEWTDIAYGKGTFVAVAQSDSSIAGTAYSTDAGLTWEEGSFAGGSTAIEFGNGRFVAIEGGFAGANNSFISFDGIIWQVGNLPVTADWRDVVYGQGLFVAVGAGLSTVATSEDGLYWESQNISVSDTWHNVVFGNPGQTPKFIALPGGEDYGDISRIISTGATAKARATVVSGRMSALNIWEPGSGYTSAPALLITDPNNTTEVSLDVRTGNGVLGNPTIVNGGSGYATTSTSVTVIGDGFKDQYPLGSDIIVSNLTRIPGPGDNVTINGIDDYTYKLLSVTVLGGDAPQYDARISVAKDIDREESPEHLTTIEIRQQYSQVRLTGHDFLLIGLGNFIQTNYPDTLNPIGTIFAPQDEVRESDGGRVFYTSTDQDGNFRVGELFAVEQATGTVTLNAQFFELQGLEELAIGGVSVGGSGVVIREFSTDPTFTADSNNILPTQRAIKAFISSRVSGGGADANTGVLVAGTVRIGPNQIDTTTGDNVNIPVKMTFKGGIDGDWLAQSYFLYGNND